MIDKLEFKYWDNGHILVGDCFLRNESLNPMINWLNLHRVEIENGKWCEGMDKINEVTYISVGGYLTIVTNRDMVFISKEDIKRFVVWLNEHRKIFNIREVKAV